MNERKKRGEELEETIFLIEDEECNASLYGLAHETDVITLAAAEEELRELKRREEAEKED